MLVREVSLKGIHSLIYVFDNIHPYETASTWQLLCFMLTYYMNWVWCVFYGQPVGWQFGMMKQSITPSTCIDCSRIVFIFPHFAKKCFRNWVSWIHAFSYWLPLYKHACVGMRIPKVPDLYFATHPPQLYWPFFGKGGSHVIFCTLCTLGYLSLIAC